MVVTSLSDFYRVLRVAVDRKTLEEEIREINGSPNPVITKQTHPTSNHFVGESRKL